MTDEPMLPFEAPPAFTEAQITWLAQFAENGAALGYTRERLRWLANFSDRCSAIVAWVAMAIVVLSSLGAAVFGASAAVAAVAGFRSRCWG
jgi:hypothetical protein